MPDVLVFDLGGVIMEHDQQRYNQLMAGLHGERADWLRSEAFAGLVFGYERGRITTEQMIAAMLTHARPDATEAEVIEAWNSLHGGIPEHRKEMLREWKQQYPLYLFSNNNPLRWQHLCDVWPEMDELFEACFASHLVGLLKPDPQYFELADKQIAADEAEKGRTYHRDRTLFVDDLAANRDAARSFGWQTCSSMEELRNRIF